MNTSMGTFIILIASWLAISLIEARCSKADNDVTVRKIVHSSKLFQSGRPYSPGVLVDKTLYIAGQVGWDVNGVIPEGIEAQTKQTMDNIGHVLAVVGANHTNVVRCMVLMANDNDVPKMSAVYETYFKENHPTRVTVEVGKLPAGALVEIECIAIVGEIINEEVHD